MKGIIDELTLRVLQDMGAIKQPPTKKAKHDSSGSTCPTCAAKQDAARIQSKQDAATTAATTQDPNAYVNNPSLTPEQNAQLAKITEGLCVKAAPTQPQTCAQACQYYQDQWAEECKRLHKILAQEAKNRGCPGWFVAEKPEIPVDCCVNGVCPLTSSATTTTTTTSANSGAVASAPQGQQNAAAQKP